jgi:hypothetical protein
MVIKKMANIKHTVKKCEFPGCNRDIIAKGYCIAHYAYYRRHNNSFNGYEPRPGQAKKRAKCLIDECTRESRVKGYCSFHYQEIKYPYQPRQKKLMKRAIANIIKDANSYMPEYKTWIAMKTRCYNPNAAFYKYYGGKGIGVCDRWLNNFINFLNDMGRKPTPKHQIDRIDSNKNYEPANCRWVTAKTNSRNRGSIKLNEEKVSRIKRKINDGDKLTDIAKEFEVSVSTIDDIKHKRLWLDV